MLEVRSLSVVRQGKETLSGLDLSVSRGKITAVIGRNGSGKSTLLSALAGVRSYSGEIYFDKTELRSISARERAKKAAFLPQILPSPQFSVYELVSLGRSPRLGFSGKMGEIDLGAVQSALELVGIAHLAEKRADRISGGELRLAYLAMILAQDAQLMILDEPTAFMDAANERSTFELISMLKKEQEKTVVLAVHDLSLALSFADDIVVLDGGKIVFCGSRDDCLDSGMIESTFNVTRHTDKSSVWFI